MRRAVLVLAGVLALVAGLAAQAAAQVSGPWTRVVFGSASGPIITSGTGSPEGVVTAPIGSVYLQTDGAAGATLWTKTATGSTGWASASGGGAGSPHGLLSTAHLDTTTASPLRGALVTGSSAPAWSRLPLGAAGTMLRSSGTDPAWSTDGSALTTLNATNISSGTLADARLSSTVSLFGAAVDNAEITAATITFAKWASNGCATGEIPKYDGAAWICGTDDAVTGGGHAVLSATHTDSVPASLVAGDLLMANGADVLTRLPIGTAGQVLTVTAGAPAWGAAAAGGAGQTTGITVDGAGSVFSTGVKGFNVVPQAGTITAVTLLSTDAAATACSVVFDVWKETYANYPPAVADTITASAKPTLSSANKSRDTTLTGWTTAVAAGDILGYTVDSVTGCTRVTLVLTIQ